MESYGIKAKTYGSSKYPLICNILSQMLFLSSEEQLVKSTIYSDEEFALNVMDEIGEANYGNIRNNLDEMLYISEDIINIKNTLKQMPSNLVNTQEVTMEIAEKEEQIARIYMDSQMIIFTMYFNRLFKRIDNFLDVKYYRTKMNSFRKLIGSFTDTSKDYNSQYFNEYYKTKTEELKLKQAEIERKNNLALVRVSENKIMQLFNIIKSSIFRLLNKGY